MAVAFGVTCGIGSLLIGARQAGFDVVGNAEWRKYYHKRDEYGRNTFTENFPGAFFKQRMTDEEFERFSNPDLVMGHPECGHVSQLNTGNKNFREHRETASDIPLFVDIVSRLRPRFFVMDDLPKAFIGYPMGEYMTALPDYDLFPEWVSNWGYGNVQKNRDRLFMIGALKSEGYVFAPSEAEHDLTVADVIGDLPAPAAGSNYPNHDPHQMDSISSRSGGLWGYGSRPSWQDTREYFEKLPDGAGLNYVASDGTTRPRIGFRKNYWDKHSYVLSGSNAILHPRRNDPLTIRERARIQGFPDDFVFYGTRLNDRGEWDHDRNTDVSKQTGKAMPVQFARYVASHIKAHIDGKPDTATGKRVLKANPFVNEAKRYFCKNREYTNWNKACSVCWLKETCEIRSR